MKFNFTMPKLQWMKNSNGEPSMMTTLTTVAFIVTSVGVIISMLDTITIGQFSVQFATPSETLLLGYMGSFLTGYVIRRNKTDSLPAEEEKVENDEPCSTPKGE